MLAERVVGAFIFSALLAAQPAAGDEPTCGGDGDRIVAYAKDRYAVRLQPDAADRDRPRFIIRQLGTDEPLEQVDCADAGPCELATVLGMRDCSYASLSSGKDFRGLSLQAVEDPARPRWTLSIDGPLGPVPIVSLNATGTLTLRAARHAGQRVLVVLSETEGGPCPRTTDYAIVLEDADIRRSAGATGQPPRRIDLHEMGADPLPPLRTARVFQAMPVETVVNAARIAAAAGMTSLAACWIAHNAAVMPLRDLPALDHALESDPFLSELGPHVSAIPLSSSAVKVLSTSARRAPPRRAMITP